jgi:hypothetical protein
MKGGLSVDTVEGPRWALAIELLSDGREFVLLDNVQLMRRGFLGDERLHIAVLTTKPNPAPDAAQAEVDAARARVLPLLQSDDGLRAVAERHGVVWEYCGDDGTATWIIGEVADDGTVRLRRS